VSFSKKMKKFSELTQLHKHFQTYFQVVPAVNEELVREAQRIRHQVYCEELGWEPTSADGLEKDEYDEDSLHCLLFSLTRGKYIGCIRLVLPRESEAGLCLPFQHICNGGLNKGHPDPVAMQQCAVAEVSRLAITSDYRRRRDEQGHPASFGEKSNANDERRKFPYIPVGLYLGMLHMAVRRDIKTLYFLTEPLLAKHFSHLGGKLTPVGEGVEHRGMRVPYVMNVHEVLSGAKLALRPLIRGICKEVNSRMEVAGQ